jgi:hypothetical protein
MNAKLRLHFAVSLTALSAMAASAQYSGTPTKPGPVGTPGTTLGQIVRCPASIIAQATNAPSPWLAGAVQMNLQSAAMTDPSASVPQMICKYAGSGAQWQIYRNVQPEFKSCAVSGTQFVCQKT